MAVEFAPQVVGRRYVLQDLIGQGGMGAVYRALDRLTGHQVALKRVLSSPPETDASTNFELLDFRMAMAQEFKLSASLRHPNIIEVLDYGFDDQRQPYFTMELLSGAQTIMQHSSTLPVADRVELIIQMLYALSYLHRRDILHRDLKPANVLVSDDRVKVLDFGLSVMRAQGQEPEEHMTAGTLAYMPPEVLMGYAATEAADLYAVGMMGYQLLAGAHPFDIKDPGKLVNQILYTLPDTTLLDVPAGVAQVLSRLLQKEPSNRYQSAAEVLDVLIQTSGHSAPADAGAIRDSFLLAARLIGRDAEIDHLSDALSTAILGRGSAWLVAGESGVGKSRLLDELRTLSMVRGALVMRGQAVNVGSRPYEMWLNVLRWLCLLLDDLTDEDIALLKTLVPELDTLLQRDTSAVPARQSSTPQEVQTDLIALLERMLRRQKRPLTVFLEDLHWAGSESLRLLEQLTALAGDLPLLVVASYRDDEQPELPQRLPAMKLLKLNRLDERSIAELSAAMLGNAGRRPQVIGLLQRETEGNVFFLVEVVRALAEDAGNLDEIGRSTLPEQVFAGGMQTVINRRLNRINPSGHALLNLAAVIGRQLDLALLQRLEPEANIDGWLTECVNAAVLDMQDDLWRFSHDKLREGVLQGLAEDERQKLHFRVAEVMDRLYGHLPNRYNALAHHWGQAGIPEREEFYTALAGDVALRNGAYHEAIRFFQRALALLNYLTLEQADLQKKRVHFKQRLGDAHLGFADYETARTLYRESLSISEEIDDQEHTAAAYASLADIATALGEFDEGHGLYEKSLSIYREINHLSGVVRALSGLGSIAFERGDDAEARRLYQESLSLSREIGDQWGMAGILRTQETPILQSEYERKRQQLEETLDNHAAASDRASMADTLFALGRFSQEAGHLVSAQGYYQRSLELWQQLGDRPGIARALERMGAVEMAREDYNIARDYLRQALQAAFDADVHDLALNTLMTVVRFLIVGGSKLRALELLAFILYSPAAQDTLQDQTESLLFELESELSAEDVAAAWEKGKDRSYKDVILELLS